MKQTLISDAIGHRKCFRHWTFSSHAAEHSEKHHSEHTHTHTHKKILFHNRKHPITKNNIWVSLITYSTVELAKSSVAWLRTSEFLFLKGGGIGGKNWTACLTFANVHALGGFWISSNVCAHTNQCVCTQETQAVLCYMIIATTLDLKSCFRFEEVFTVILSLLFPLRAFVYNQAYFVDWWESDQK